MVAMLDEEAVSLREVPRRLLVIGGGIIGMELGGAYQHLGSEVTIVEALPNILTGVDPDVAAPAPLEPPEPADRYVVGTRRCCRREHGPHVWVHGPPGGR